eukprot:Phypoly_transcript_13248.p1 GENE.Phypoly_transcript_13248~~Phypoly_transcript_13248.p1  ORF type:complete len:337 (+),score=41.19 Phypoly_transcript_13248:26-1012(+)
MADDGGWVQVQAKKPPQKPQEKFSQQTQPNTKTLAQNQQRTQQSTRPQSQRPSQPRPQRKQPPLKQQSQPQTQSQQSSAQQPRTPRTHYQPSQRPSNERHQASPNLNIQTPKAQSQPHVHTSESHPVKSQHTPTKPATLHTPPKSILSYGESNLFDIGDNVINSDTIETTQKQLPANKNRYKKSTEKEKPLAEFKDTPEVFEEEPVTHFFGLLPPEVAMYVLTFFDLPLLCNFSLVSKFCHSFAVDDALWKPMFRRDWGSRRGGGAVKRKKRIEPAKGKWRKRYLQLFLNKRNAEKDKQRMDMRMLIYYTKTFNLNMKKARQNNSLKR